MDRFIGHFGHYCNYGYYCDYCLARWKAATMFDYSILLVVIIVGGWLASRLQSRSVS